MASAGSLHVNIGARTAGLTRGLRRAQRSVQRTARKMQRAGRKMTQAITLPLAAAGGAAVKFAADMEQSLAQAQAQAGLTDQAMQRISDSAEEVAISTGQSFEKVVDAFKFAQSAGLDMAESQEIVETSAKAAAAGFGDQTTLLRGMTTVMAGFGDEAGSSAEIMDKLVSSAQNMEVKVPSLTEIMGQLSQVSSEVGLSFSEMLAAVGSVGEQFGDVSRAGNLMATSLTQLLDPSQKVRDLMEQVGTSAEEVRANIEEKGLTQAMVTLRNRTEAAGVEFASMVGSARSARVMLALTSSEGRRVAEIMEDAEDSTGALNRAFQNSESFSRLLSKAWQSLRVALRPLGEMLINTLSPALTKLAAKAQELSSRFESMSNKMQANVVAASALAAALGPILFVVGKLVSAVASLGSALASLSWPVAAVVAFAGSVGVAIARWEELATFVGRIWANLKEMFSSGTELLSLLWQQMTLDMERAFAAVAKKVINLFSNVAQFASSLGVSIADPFAVAFGLMEQESKSWGEQAKKDVEEVDQKISDASKRFANAAIGAFGRMALAPQRFGIAGVNAIDDLLSHARSRFAELRNLFMGGVGGGAAGDTREEAGVPAAPLEQVGGADMQQLTQRLPAQLNVAAGETERLRARLAAMREEAFTGAQVVVSGLRSMGTQMGVAIQQASSIGDAFKNMGRTVVSALEGMITKMATFAAIAGVISAIPGGGAALGLGSGFGGIFGGLMGLQHGGLVTGPTLAMVGEGPGTSRSNPEVVAPLDKLEQLIAGASRGQGGTLEARIGLDELIFRLEQRQSHISA